MSGEVFRQAYLNSPTIGLIYKRLFFFLSVVWVWYPVLWALGGSGFQILSPGTEAAIYSILDVAAKVGFGIATLLYLSNQKTALSK